ncbi:hypothetical protein D8674_011701 [Pyrus ussuriensis x Pyrus communis]|uniref:Sulfite exporter TauE/SafE family protein 3-like n=1 Tax=Pyrus ussuriensis x Pyrus communis TaxID=2448454 RepID=A0A5N5FZL0_9ROSA|nr:hypothetical protein D8674_011701 [Pyrus ussuriensis x Pyrus communis]
MLTLIVGFDTKYDNGGISIITVVQSKSAPHPTKEVPIIDYELAILFQPMLMLGITLGVSLSVTSSRSCFKGAEGWKEDTILKVRKEYARLQEQILMFNLRWQKVLVLVAVWNKVNACGTWYWVLFCLESTGSTESICEASIAWTLVHIAFCALCGILGGTVGGLLRSGGGFILGPLFLEIGVIPQVASATATFVMTFSSSLSVVEFYLLKRFPILYAIYLTSMSILVGFWGQLLVRRVAAILKRASIIVFILFGVIFASAITMGVISIKTSIQMIANHDFMGFLEFYSSQ